jgi:SAM-dependent methyltransferase
MMQSRSMQGVKAAGDHDSDRVNKPRHCQICRTSAESKVHRVKENSLGLQTEFYYSECGICGCLQLESVPNNLAEYYPPKYYSFRPPPEYASILGKSRRYIRTIRNRSYFQRGSVLGRILQFTNPHLVLRCISEVHPGPEARILDVGCGSGAVLQELHDVGFNNLLGVDPFIAADLEYGNGVRVVKGELSELAETEWELMMFHHSFEHIPDPLETLKKVAKMLSAQGHCVIRIPVASWAWDNYGADWVQLDAPRHYFLHSEKSLKLLAKEAGLDVRRIEYDSDEFQFWGSELVRRGVPVSSVSPAALREFFGDRELRDYRERSKELNRLGRGDQAAFYLVKAGCVSA